MWQGYDGEGSLDRWGMNPCQPAFQDGHVIKGSHVTALFALVSILYTARKIWLLVWFEPSTLPVVCLTCVLEPTPPPEQRHKRERDIDRYRKRERGSLPQWHWENASVLSTRWDHSQPGPTQRGRGDRGTKRERVSSAVSMQAEGGRKDKWQCIHNKINVHFMR